LANGYARRWHAVPARARRCSACLCSLRRKRSTRADLASKVIIRSLKLYAIGCFINGGATLSQWRLLGVLQYFAVGYLVVGLLETFLCPPPAPELTEGSFGWGAAAVLRAAVHDVGRYWKQWVVMGTLAAAYLMVSVREKGSLVSALWTAARLAWSWAWDAECCDGLLRVLAIRTQTEYLLPVPGCPTGYLGAGGLADNGAYLGKGCTGGAHRAVDIAIFGEAHMYHGLDGDGNPISRATCSGEDLGVHQSMCLVRLPATCSRSIAWRPSRLTTPSSPASRRLRM
jgi:heparan-alpha-glucosaminide N-acetyltransferase